MSDRLITADASAMNGTDFFHAVTGRPRKTKEDRLREWQADVERAADAIENGFEALVSPPLLHDARLLVAGRQRARRAA